MTIDELKNETISKLNRHEIGFFGLINQGVYTYKGILKSRKQGYKTVKVNENQTNFVGKAATIEVVKIVSVEDEDEYAFRVKDNETSEYVTDYNVLLGCQFLK